MSMPIFDPKSEIDYISDNAMCLFKPGDIIEFKSVDRAHYDHVTEEVAAGRFAPKMKPVTFLLDDFNADIDGYNKQLEGLLDA